MADFPGFTFQYSGKIGQTALIPELIQELDEIATTPEWEKQSRFSTTFRINDR